MVEPNVDPGATDAVNEAGEAGGVGHQSVIPVFVFLPSWVSEKWLYLYE